MKLWISGAGLLALILAFGACDGGGSSDDDDTGMMERPPLGQCRQADHCPFSMGTQFLCVTYTSSDTLGFCSPPCDMASCQALGGACAADPAGMMGCKVPCTDDTSCEGYVEAPLEGVCLDQVCGSYVGH